MVMLCCIILEHSTHEIDKSTATVINTFFLNFDRNKKSGRPRFSTEQKQTALKHIRDDIIDECTTFNMFEIP